MLLKNRLRKTLLHPSRLFIGILFLALLFVFLQLQFSKPVGAALTVKAKLVKTIKTSSWSPPSPDPSGIALQGSKLIITDAEVEEMSIYKGKNYFESSLSGSLSSTGDTTSFTKEPAGVAVGQGTYFFSDDGKKRVFKVNPGSDKKIGTSDDKISSFSTSSFGSSDPEGIAFGNGKLYIADGVGSEVYIVDPSGGKASHFDVGKYGVKDPEGIEFNSDNGNLFVLGNGKSKLIIEVTTQGKLVRNIDISAAGAKKPAGLAYSPGNKHFYIVDRGVDNNSNPNENDGKIYELSF
ncbi:MAG TPA: hypothetical protein VJL83_00495 [Patescibacteria group bacterium]|nr:hypothetical protein [Patescibacteria group bacterium]